MSSKPENIDLKSEIYENLPCHNNLQQANNCDDDIITNTSINNINNNHHNNQTNNNNVNNISTNNNSKKPKELLYATPLRKSDRYASKRNNETSKIVQKTVYSQIQFNNGIKPTNTSSCSSKEYKIENNENIVADSYQPQPPHQHHHHKNISNESLLEEDRRIRNFLRDASQQQLQHKKCEIQQNFSFLTKEEHFANLVQQNVIIEPTESSEMNSIAMENLKLDETYTMEELEARCNTNLEYLTNINGKVSSPNKTVTKMDNDYLPSVDNISGNNIAPSSLRLPFKRNDSSEQVRININREWVMKKIAMCLEQRAIKKPIPIPPNNEICEKAVVSSTNDSAAITSTSFFARSNIPSHASQPHLGCLILGSNGSGKTSICDNILEGTTGTRGILNRRLLSCYFINSQNPECHSLSMFIRSIILQILSHSSYIERECEDLDEASSNVNGAEARAKKLLLFRRQNSAPNPPTTSKEVSIYPYTTHPPLIAKSTPNTTKDDNAISTKKDVDEVIVSPSKKSSSSSTPSKTKISKIPIPIRELNKSQKESQCDPEAGTKHENKESDLLIEHIPDDDVSKQDEPNLIDLNEINGDSSESNAMPTPLPPKSKSCRMLIANQYYEMLINNTEIFDSLNVDNIEKNPDECFKKAILFPLLELTPPKSALLLIVDSIDENYINDGTLITTLKTSSNSRLHGNTINKSKNIAELLSNHFHLFPKWLFLLCTAKKQNKYITKMFNGFKKITLDDLRKSHVVKDVQEYIINRLNTDFKGIFNLTKEIIENLNQLYIKSNGCILYLQKVLNGIKDNFFTFREIKLIPCTLNGLYLYICQKSFNKKQYNKIRPILNILLACSNYVEQDFIYNCLRMHNFTIDRDEFQKRLIIMNNIIKYDQNKKIKIFHNSFCDWLVDVKFSTKKFLCDVNEGHIMISMYYTCISDTLCPNLVRRYIHHLIKSGEYLINKNINLDLILILLESKTNLSDCFYTNLLNCCHQCENECKNDKNLLPKTKKMLEKFFYSELNTDFMQFLCDFFKPNLPTDAKILKLLIETGINNIDSRESSLINSPEHNSDKSQNIDSELAELLISSEKSCQQEIQRTNSLRNNTDMSQTKSTTTSSIQNPDYDNSNVGVSSSALELHKGKALIHILANEGNHLLLERALKACKDPIDLEIEDLHGQTALNIAARNGYIEIVKILLNFKQPLNDGTGRTKGVDVNHPDRDGWTPLRSASWGGHTEVVKLLISHTDCAIDYADREGRTALRAAAWSGHEDILKILLEAGANVNSVDKQGRTSLIAASYMGHYDIVEILLENGSDVNHLDLDGRSALCVAALCGSSGYNKVISTLLEHGANTDQLDNDGMSPLLVSSFEGNSEICELLLENGADPDLADHMGRTSLWAACTAGHANVVKLLLFWGCSIDCMDSEGRTVLSIAAAQGNLETVRQLLDRGLDETHRDNAGWTPLHYAAFEGYADICVQLLESGAKIDECDNEGKTALHLAAQEGHNAVIEALLDIHSACVDQRAHDGKTAFRLACLEGHFESIHTLLKYGCDVNSKDADSRTTLYILALENKLKMVKFLFEFANVDVNIPDAEGRTALHVAAWQGHVEMVKMLIAMGRADVNAMDLECRTPLHSCAWQGNHQVMEILLYYGALGDHACKQGATALGICSQEGHEECVKILLQYGANPFKSDHCGRTPIKLAAKSNRTNVLRILESFAKNEPNLEMKQCHQNLLLKSPDKPTEKQILLPPAINSTSHSPNLLVPNISMLNTTNSTQSSNFYENTMHSDHSSLQKRKSVVSNQSTESSNDAPISFTQQLQKHTRHGSRSSSNHHSIVGGVVGNSTKYDKNAQKFTQILPNVNEYQTNIATNISANEADMFDCMSPLYATPPHSPSSDISSPGQHQPSSHFSEIGGSGVVNNFSIVATADQHFARDTHMRIILGNNKDCNVSQGKQKRSGIATNPAVRMIRSRFDSAAQVIRRANNILNISSSNNHNQGSSSIGVKSSTFQWRKESQM